MDKKEVSTALKKHCKGASFISCSQLETFLGFGHNKTADILAELDALEVNGRRKYFIGDVAGALMERVSRWQ